MPVPVVVERAPPTIGVSGDPLDTLMLLVNVQSLSSAPFQPLTSVRRRGEPVLYCQFRFST